MWIIYLGNLNSALCNTTFLKPSLIPLELIPTHISQVFIYINLQYLGNHFACIRPSNGSYLVPYSLDMLEFKSSYRSYELCEVKP